MNKAIRYSSTQSGSEISGRWRPEELLDSQFLANLMKCGEVQKGGWSAYLNKAQLMRGEDAQNGEWSAYFNKNPCHIRLGRNMHDRPLIDIELAPKSNMVTSIASYIVSSKPEFAGLVLELENLEIFRSESAEKLGFKPSELSAGRQTAEGLLKILHLNAYDISLLRPSSEYAGNKDNTVLVLQDESVIIESGHGVYGLHTFGASSCSILIVVSRDSKGTVKRAGLAHIDFGVQKEQIIRFLNMAKLGDIDPEIYVIGGDKETALHVLESCEAIRAQIKFFCANLDLSRSDAAIVDFNGTVYYGKFKDLLALLNEEGARQRLEMFKSQMLR